MVKSLLSAMVSLALLMTGSIDARASDASVPGSQIDFSASPFVIFAPAPPLPAAISDYPLPDGAEDYWDLWAADAPWMDAAEHIDAFAMHAWMVRYSSTDQDLRRMFAWLADHDIPLALEVEPLTWPGPEVCDHTEGFEGPYDLEVAQRIRDLGGEVAFIVLDEPYSHAHKATGPGACGYPVEQVVDEVAEFVRSFRAIHPGIEVGSIEPIVSWPRLTARDIEIWLDTWQERTGEPFAFLSIDVDWRQEDWPPAVREMEAVADSRGVPFGMLYLGSEFDSSNDAWLASLAEHFATFEVDHGGTPDVVGLYSWHSQPDVLLPDDDIDAFTGRVNQYFGVRTTFEGQAIKRKGRVVTGRLATLEGDSLAGRTLRVRAEPLDGAKLRHKLSGSVPMSARQALIAVRANAEGGAPSPVDVRIFDISYREDGTGPNLVPNPRFAKGLEDWGSYGQGSVRVSGGKGGRSMLLRAKPHQAVLVDGVPFKVTPGADYDFTALIDTAGQSIGSGFVSVIFLGDAEVARENLWFATRPIALPSVVTDEEGMYRITTDSLRRGRYVLSVDYEGDIDHWPARTTTRLKLD